MPLKKIAVLLSSAVGKWWSDNPWRLSAALSYYTLFSLAPLPSIAVGMAALVVNETTVQEALQGQFESLLGTTGAQAVSKMLQSAGRPVHGRLATMMSVVTLFIVSMAMFSELQDALNLIWKIPSRSTSAALWGLIRTRLLSFVLVVGTGFLLVASLIMKAVVAAAEAFIHRSMLVPDAMMTVIHVTGSLVHWFALSGSRLERENSGYTRL
jgi:membrane protein